MERRYLVGSWGAAAAAGAWLVSAILFFSPQTALADGISNCKDTYGGTCRASCLVGMPAATYSATAAPDKVVCEASYPLCCPLPRFCESPTTLEVVPGVHGAGGTCRSACGAGEKDSGLISLDSSGCTTAKPICCVADTPKVASVPDQVSCSGQVVNKTDSPTTACPKLAMWKDVDLLKGMCGVIAYNSREEYRAMYAALNCSSVEPCTSEGATRDKSVTIESGVEKQDCNDPAFNTDAKKQQCIKGNAEIDAMAAKSSSSAGAVKQVCKNGFWTNTQNMPMTPGSSTVLRNPLGTTDIPTIIGRVVRTFLGIVGGLGLLVFVYAGILYMTAAGEPKKIQESVDTMKYAFIGMALIIFAYVITDFYFKALIQGGQ